MEVSDIQLTLWIIGVAAGAFTIYKGLLEIKLSRELREQELVWSQAKLAREILYEFSNSELYQNAERMIDWKSGEFTTGKGETFHIRRSEVLLSLRTDNLVFNEKERYIRECLIHYFNSLRWLEHYADRNLITLDDIKHTLSYTISTLSVHKNQITPFLKKYQYETALKLLERFPEWDGTSS